MNGKRIYLLIAILLIGSAGYLISKNHSTPPFIQTGKIQVSTSFYPLYFFAQQIGGDKAEVKNITPAGAEPHDYDPTTQDLARIENSQLLILNGGVEAWGDKIKENLKGKTTKIVIAGEDLLSRQLTEDGQTTKDPHVWLSPQLAKKEVEKITDGYIAIDRKDSQFFKDNQNILNAKLDQLNQEYKTGLSNCSQKDIVTSHAAFGYLGDTYGLNQVSIAGLSPDEEPSSKQLAETANFAKAHQVKYIFFESLVSPKLSDTIASEVGAKTLVLDPLEGISSEDLESGKDYFTVMRDNLTNLQIALQCSK